MLKLRSFTLATLGVNLGVILWGAWVRASGSGAGCGAKWPLCGDNLIPQSPTMHTITELAHRLSSGVALLMVIGMVLLARRQFSSGHPARRWAWVSLLFIVLEALIGAGLVLFRYVAQDDSMARAMWLGAHLLNTMLMLGAFWLTWWSAQDRQVPTLSELAGSRPWLLPALLALMLTGMAGAVASLGTTLFPSGSLAEGVAQDFSPTAHLLLRLRVLHPLIAVMTGLAWVLLARNTMTHHDDATSRSASTMVLAMVCVQWAIGAMTLLLNAPVAAQLIHLVSADVLWLCCVQMTLALVTAQTGRTIPESRRAASVSNTFPAPDSR